MRRLPQQFWVLWGGNLLHTVGEFVVWMTVFYLTRELRQSAQTAGTVVAAMSVVSLVGSVVSGHVSDRIGRKPMLLAGQGIGILAMIGLLSSRDIAVVIGALLVHSFGAGVLRPMFQAMLADVVAVQDRKLASSLAFWGTNIGFAVSSMLAGYVATVSYRLGFVLNGVGIVVYLAITWWMLRESRPKVAVQGAAGGAGAGAGAIGDDGHIAGTPQTVQPEVAEPYSGRRRSWRAAFQRLPHKVFLLYVALSSVGTGAYVVMYQGLTQTLQEQGRSPQFYGNLMVVNTGLIVVLQLVVTRLVARRSHGSMVSLGGFIIGIGLCGFAFGMSLEVLVAAIVVVTIGEMIQAGSMMALGVDLSPWNRRGEYSAWVMVGRTVGISAGSFMAGFVVQHWSAWLLWTGAGLAAMTAAAGFWAARRAMQTHSERVHAVNEAALAGA